MEGVDVVPRLYLGTPTCMTAIKLSITVRYLEQVSYERGFHGSWSTRLVYGTRFTRKFRFVCFEL